MSWLIAGLGNSPEKYHQTRHNAGFWFVDQLAADLDCSFQSHKLSAKIATANLGNQTIRIIKPNQFMNHSGISVAEFVNYYKIEKTRVVICHDELDYLPGICRLKLGGSAAGHNGVIDCQKALGFDQLIRLRIGIGRDKTIAKNNSSGKDFVLSEPTKNELELIEQSFAKVNQAIKILIEQGLEKAMLQLHSQ